jgi:putative phosphoesterase
LKIALIGDVHANLPALDAVLEHARQRDVEAIWNLGDFVGYSAFPDEVVRRLRQDGEINVVGNYDLKVLGYPDNKEKWRKARPPEKGVSVRWSYKNLSGGNRRHLGTLPRDARLRVKGRSILLTHASPAAIDESLGPHTSDRRLRKLAEEAQADLIVVGHSHQPFVREVGDVRFINPGSVGRPDDGDPRASYAILSLTKKRLKVKHYRLDYDVEKSVEAIRRADLPEAFAQILLLGHSLDWVLSHRHRWKPNGKR